LRILTSNTSNQQKKGYDSLEAAEEKEADKRQQQQKQTDFRINTKREKRELR